MCSCSKFQQMSFEWKKVNVVPTYKKNNKQLVRSYRPISLLPILFITNYFISFKKTTLSHQINLDSSLGTRALINYWLLLTKYINHLTMDMKWGESFSIFLKHYGPKVLLKIKAKWYIRKTSKFNYWLLSNRKLPVVLNRKYSSWIQF